MTNFFKNLFIGILIGSGAILPGISSGVILVSFGLYEKLLNTILYFFKNIKENLKLLIPIIIGCIIGIVLFGNILNSLYTLYPNLLKFCFIGLILGTIPTVIKTANKTSKYFEVKNFLLSLSSFIITILMIFIEKNMTNSLLSTSQFNYFYLILSGFLMSIGIVVPRNK
ncbi:MAG: DUF368 domain-containing protein [Clostridia bacterium]|nr:DUF368 domain-containing protein [Clostridia bacterium]